MKRKKKKVLLIGWDAADWKFITPLLDQGLMPNLQKLIEGGVKGRLATLDPPLSPTLWTSIATGKRPYKHGVHGFTEPNPHGVGIRPIPITNRKVKAIWNILSQHDFKTHVVGWWPSHPAEPINGIMISNFYQQVTAAYGEEWPLPLGCIHPKELTEVFAGLRVHPKELTAAHVVPFVPDAWKVDQRQDQSLQKIAKLLGHCSSLHAATTYILDNYEWDFTALYLDAIDHFCHEFMDYHPPHRPHISMQDFELYKNVINGACIYHDMMLGRLMELAGEEATIILISDHGFHPDQNRPTEIPREPIGPTIEHSTYGIFVAKGPGIKKDELIFGASLLDITPTLLHLFDLPTAEDMDGKVLQIFEDVPAIEPIKSWEEVPGEDGTHKAVVELSPEENEAELRQLIDLGYIQDPGDDLEAAAKQAREENNFYLARAYIDGGEWVEAVKILEELYVANPNKMRYSTRLCYAYQQLGQFKKSRSIVDYIKENYDRESPYIDVLEGSQLLVEQKFRLALKIFQRAEKEAGNIPKLNMYIANAYLQLNQLEEAQVAVQKQLKLDSEDASAQHLLGVIYYRKMRYEEAVEAFMNAIGLHYYYPAAHYYLGETLMAMERYEDAAHAFEVCLHLLPGLNIAREKLISIYEHFLQQPGKAAKFRSDFEMNLKGEVIVVSGLPRSGTSMLMQMLEAGGIDLFIDHKRGADESNPRGYYEHEAIKSVSKNKSWLPEAKGKAVKVIAQLLGHLPRTYRYKVIFTDRNILEVIQSQQKMLIRDGKKVTEDVLPIGLHKSYQETLQKVKEWANTQPNVEILYLKHEDILKAPFSTAMKINDFLDQALEMESMAAVVDTKLHREKLTPSSS